jgi:predicted phosphodiesterase
MPERINLPESLIEISEAVDLTVVGKVGIISDLHIPWHVRQVVEMFVKQCKKDKVKRILLNGDIGDNHQISRFYREPTAPDYASELRLQEQFVYYVRQENPQAEIDFKEGNHDKRLLDYYHSHAPELKNVPDIQLPKLLHLDKYGVNHIDHWRKVKIGKLYGIHGHEIAKGYSSPANPAKWLYDKARDHCFTSHWHRSDSYTGRTISDKVIICRSIGCACHCNPRWGSVNNWNNGFAFVDVYNNGEFNFWNYTVVDGKMYLS